MAVLIGSPDASAQSFKERLKNAAKKVEQKVEQKVASKKSDNTSSGGKEQPKSSYNATLGTGTYSGKDKATETLFGKDHTALFAPVGTPVDAKYGTKSVTPVKPPKEWAKQPDWNETRTFVYELDNKSLVDEFVMMCECRDSGYIDPLSPAYSRHGQLLDELSDRTDALNIMVENYNDAVFEYARFITGEDDENEWLVELHYNVVYNRVLASRAYHTLIRSSLAPLFSLNDYIKDFIEDYVKVYFDAHGGYENAHKAKWTVLKAPKTNK